MRQYILHNTWNSFLEANFWAFFGLLFGPRFTNKMVEHWH
jgi:hypothetical protein